MSNTAVRRRSLPSRERGLKLKRLRKFRRGETVAPFTGAWIETASSALNILAAVVAPFTGAWIETVLYRRSPGAGQVAPFTGAWIETAVGAGTSSALASRSLHGSVD